jgi:hypothetical protein
VQQVKRGSTATCAFFFDRTAMFRPGTISKQADTDAAGGRRGGAGMLVRGRARRRAEFENDRIQAHTAAILAYKKIIRNCSSV